MQQYDLHKYALLKRMFNKIEIQIGTNWVVHQRHFRSAGAKSLSRCFDMKRVRD